MLNRFLYIGLLISYPNANLFNIIDIVSRINSTSLMLKCLYHYNLIKRIPVMTTNKFTIEIGEDSFIVIKLFDDDGDYSLYILPYNKNIKGFFMTKDEDGIWTIFNKVLVSPHVLRIEEQLRDILVKELM